MKKDKENEISENKEKRHIKINPNNEIKMKDSNTNKYGKYSRSMTSENLGQKEKVERAKVIDKEEKIDKDNLLTSMDYQSYLNEINEKKKQKKIYQLEKHFVLAFS